MKEIAIMRGFFHTVQHDHMRRYITVPGCGVESGMFPRKGNDEMDLEE